MAANLTQKRREQNRQISQIRNSIRAMDTQTEKIQRQLDNWARKKLLLEREDMPTIAQKWDDLEKAVQDVGNRMAGFLQYINNR